MKYQPMPLGRRAKPFDDPEWLFELKYDGFRAIAHVEFGRCTLYSGNGHPFASFQDLAVQIGNALIPEAPCWMARLSAFILAVSLSFTN